MDLEDKIEIARNALHSAMNGNCDTEKILEISREVDKYVVKYYKKCYRNKSAFCQKCTIYQDCKISSSIYLKSNP